MPVRSEDGFAPRRLVRAQIGGACPELDEVACEEPLEIRVAGDTVVTTLRTPGADRQLALGFLYAEGVIRSIDDVGTVAPCGRPGEEGYGNVLDIAPGPGVALDPEKIGGARRGTLVTGACGACGRRSIRELVARCGALPASPGQVPLSLLRAATAGLFAGQRTFQRTGGTHAAAALAASGEVLAMAEDIGRHNAVDKVLGALLLMRRIGAGARGPGPVVLAVSGRAGFEIVQKAAAAAVPVLASVSASSTLAIDLAEALGVTVAAFVRGESVNLYSHPERIDVSA
jgi:FdhD protein